MRSSFRLNGIVTKLSAIPCQVSSDVHEWRNDWGTVSRIRLVKIQWG